MKLVIGIAVHLSFIAWFTVSVASQFSDNVGDRFPRIKTLGLIPLWTFFAPRPGMHDMHLLYRDKLGDGGLGPASYVPTIEGRCWYHVIWNPRKMHNKVLSDLTDSLGLLSLKMLDDRKENSRAIMLSTPYLTLVNLVMRMPQPRASTARQFILVRDRSFGPDPDRAVVFLSEFHRLADH